MKTFLALNLAEFYTTKGILYSSEMRLMADLEELASELSVPRGQTILYFTEET